MFNSEERLFTPSFIAICIANLLIYVSFYMLFPVLPIYLLDVLHSSQGMMGIILSCYTIGVLTIRPASGLLVDTYPRKVLYCLCAAAFSILFSGYLFFHTLILVAVLRAVHGMSFGLLTTSSSTLAVDIIPVNKLGTGIGFYGVTMSVAMALGPMVGMLLLEHWSYDMVFISALGCSVCGCACGLLVRHNKTIPPHKPFKMSWDSFFLKKGFHAFISQGLCGFFYGLMVNFLSVFARERAIDINPGFFFCLLAIGTLSTRFGSGRLIDRGHIAKLIIGGTSLVACSGLMFAFSSSEFAFFSSAVGIGVGYGLLTPAYQALFIGFSDPDERGKANSTFYIAWDGSIGTAVFCGGMLSQMFGLQCAYLIGIAMLCLSVLCFIRYTIPDMRLCGMR